VNTAWAYAPFGKIVENIKISGQDNQNKLALSHVCTFITCDYYIPDGGRLIRV
jgi:hypothetical protein